MTVPCDGCLILPICKQIYNETMEMYKTRDVTVYGPAVIALSWMLTAKLGYKCKLIKTLVNGEKERVSRIKITSFYTGVEYDESM